MFLSLPASVLTACFQTNSHYCQCFCLNFSKARFQTGQDCCSRWKSFMGRQNLSFGRIWRDTSVQHQTVRNSSTNSSLLQSAGQAAPRLQCKNKLPLSTVSTSKLASNGDGTAAGGALLSAFTSFCLCPLSSCADPANIQTFNVK